MALDRAMSSMKRIQHRLQTNEKRVFQLRVFQLFLSLSFSSNEKTDLYIQLPDVHEERLDSIIVLPFMQQHKLHIWTETHFSIRENNSS